MRFRVWISPSGVRTLGLTAMCVAGWFVLMSVQTGCRSSTRIHTSPVVSDTTTAAGQFFGQLVAEVGLSPRQEREVRSILADHWRQAEEIRAKYADAAGARSQAAGLRELRGLRERTDKALQAILTRDQMGKYLKLREKLGQDFLARPEKP